jgi:S-adenosylmethionine:tRNA ribosyltransferase-isomerase
VARLDTPGDLLAWLADHGRPIRYGEPAQPWPIDAYQTVFATEPGSAEMPSAARGFTAELVTALVSAGVVVAPLLLHCGVSSPEAGEAPQPERYRVPAATAALVNAARSAGRRVVAVGTTAVRALETVTDETGTVHPGQGWTELVITPDRGVRAVDGLITGWHEPEASHLELIAAVADPDMLERSYAEAHALGYHGHEFGDFHLLLPTQKRPELPLR